VTYNLLVSADADAWDRGSYVLSYGRFLEATDEEFVERFRSLDAASISSLVKFPALFAYETFVGKLARVGRITSIARRGLDVRITFEFNEQVPALSSEQLDTLSWDLELGSLSFQLVVKASRFAVGASERWHHGCRTVFSGASSGQIL